MTKPLRIGLFPFLNVQPLVFGLRSNPHAEVVLDTPSRISDLFREGKLDAAMVPSFEAATLDADISNSLCIASHGAVETVVLHHREPLHRVRTLALDEASRTSAALAKILIADASGRAPACTAIRATDAAEVEADAILVIGDPAFTFGKKGFVRLDLGEAWLRLHSLPFVFAVMCLGPRALESNFSAVLHEALVTGLENAPTIARSYNSGVEPERALRYLRTVIGYEFGDLEKEGLDLFYRKAAAKGLLIKPKELRFHAD